MAQVLSADELERLRQAGGLSNAAGANAREQGGSVNGTAPPGGGAGGGGTGGTWQEMLAAYQKQISGIDISAPNATAGLAVASLAEVPEGLTPQQLAIMKSRVSAGAEAQATTALAGLTRQLGGSSQASAIMGARLKASAGTGAAGFMADVDVQEAQLTRNLTAQINQSNAALQTGVSQTNAGLQTQVSLANAENALQAAMTTAGLKAQGWATGLGAGMQGLGLDLQKSALAQERELELKRQALEKMKLDAMIKAQDKNSLLAGLDLLMKTGRGVGATGQQKWTDIGLQIAKLLGINLDNSGQTTAPGFNVLRGY